VNVRESDDMRVEAERGRMLVEESREIVVVLDEEQRVIGASRRARESLQGLEEGRPLPPELVGVDRGAEPLAVVYEVDGRQETLLYLSSPGDLTAYEELRAGFTAAVSHELRTPLARLLALLESASLPDADPLALVDQARGEVEQIDELIGEVLFLSELETGREVVALGTTPVRQVLDEVVERLADRAARAAVEIRIEAPADLELPLRRRMLRVVVENLLENAIRYAGDGARVRVTVRPRKDSIVLTVRDDGRGVAEEDLPRIFERFYRADQARASRGTGLGLAIVKHVIAAAGGSVEALNRPEGGLEIRATLPA